MGKTKKKTPLDSVGKIIKEAREKAGLREIDLVWKLNDSKVTLKTVKNWEKGKELPDIDMIYTLSEMFNLNPNQLLDLKSTIIQELHGEPDWAARRIGDKLLSLAKPGYEFVSFMSKIILAIILVLVWKYIHATYEATDNPVVLDTQQILGNYLNEENNLVKIENSIEE